MEERAAIASLAASSRPHEELASLLDFAPYPEAELPHSRGFCRVLRRFLEYLLDNAPRFPAIDADLNLCRQLHRLSAAEIREVARALAEEDGMVE